MLKTIAFLIVSFLISCFVSAQNVGIGTVNPHPSAMLDVNSDTRGFLPPRMNFAQIKAIPNPTAGLLVYDTEYKCIRLFNGIEWIVLQQQDKSLTEPPGDFVAIHDTTKGSPLINGITPWGVKADGNGNVFVTGSFYGRVSFGSFTITSAGLSDLFLAKYNTTGDVVWVKTSGGAAGEVGFSIAIDAQNNICVTGAYSSNAVTFGSTTLTNAGGYDIFVVKYDAAGNVLWATGNGGSGNDLMFSITTDAAGNFYTCGYYNSSTFVYGPSLITGTGTDENIIIAKYNNNGAVQWARTAGGSTNDRGFNIAADAAGNLYFTGFFTSSLCFFGGSFILPRSGATDAFIAAYDAGGNPLWVRNNTSSAGNTCQGLSIAVDNSGTIIYTGGWYNGSSTSFGGVAISNFSPSTFNAYLAKYSNTGTVTWVKDAGGVGDDNILSLALDNTGNVYATGSFGSPSANFTPLQLNNANVSSGSAGDIFLVKYNSIGSAIWAKGGGGLNDDAQSGLQNITVSQQPNDFKIYVITNYVPAAKFGNAILTSGSYLLWKYRE